MVVRRPSRMIDSGVQPQRGIGDVLLEEAGRAGIRLVGDAARAALQPLATSFSPEGSIGREFVSPEIREMKRKESDAIAAQRVAPYFESSQATQRRQMMEQGMTGREQMKQTGQTGRTKLSEGSDILQAAMQMQGKKELLNMNLEYKERVARAARRASKGRKSFPGMTDQETAYFKLAKDMIEAAGKGPDKNMVLLNLGTGIISKLAASNSNFAKLLRDGDEPEFTPSPTETAKAGARAKLKKEEQAARKELKQIELEAEKDLEVIKQAGRDNRGPENQTVKNLRDNIVRMETAVVKSGYEPDDEEVKAIQARIKEFSDALEAIEGGQPVAQTPAAGQMYDPAELPPARPVQ